MSKYNGEADFPEMPTQQQGMDTFRRIPIAPKLEDSLKILPDNVAEYISKLEADKAVLIEFLKRIESTDLRDVGDDKERSDLIEDLYELLEKFK